KRTVAVRVSGAATAVRENAPFVELDDGLTVEGEVEPGFLVLLGNPQPSEGLDHQGDHRRCRRRIGHGDQYAVDLRPYVGARRGRVDGRGGEHARQYRADKAGNAVDAEHVERIV